MLKNLIPFLLTIAGCASSEVQSNLSNRPKALLDVGGGDQYEGSIDREAIRRTIRKHLSEVRECYLAELKADPTVKGKMVIEFVINDQGKVKDSVVQKTTMESKNPEKSTASCVNSLFKTWDFPAAAAKTEATVIYPLVFESNK